MGLLDRFRKKTQDAPEQQAAEMPSAAAVPVATPAAPPDPQQRRRLKIRKAVEYKALPAILHERGVSFLEDLGNRGEDVLVHIYAQLVQPDPSPYTASHFGVFGPHKLDGNNIIKIEMPKADLLPGASKRVYLLYDDNCDHFYYYTIEVGETLDTVGQVLGDGTHLDHGPVEARMEISRLQQLMQQAQPKPDYQLGEEPFQSDEEPLHS